MRSFIPAVVILLVAGAISASVPNRLQDNRIKVACVGNSVTVGYGLKDPATESYPSQLGNLLGEKYEVRNFGKSGVTLLYKGNNPYIRTEEYRKALDFHADVIIIDLGLHDTDPRNWPDYQDEFIPDYQRFIRSFTTKTGKLPEVFICMMTPVFPGHPRFKSGTRDWFYQIQECIRKVSQNTGAFLIDVHTPLHRRPDLFADNLHPDREGAGIMAKTIYSALTGNYGGFRLAPVFGNHMVVQQKKPVLFYGSSDRGDKIEIRLDKHYRILTVGASGQWQTAFSPLPAGGPYKLQIWVNGSLKTNWKNLLSGEVWMCSGQSNMAFELKNAENGKSTANEAHDPGLRLFLYQGFISTDNIAFDSASLDRINQLEYFNGGWQTDTPESAAAFSAVAYYFGMELRKKLKVPVGLVQVAVGGAPVEAFIDRKSLEFHPILADEFLNREKNDFIMEWVRHRIARNIEQSNVKSQRHPYDPAFVFEAGIVPLGSFPIQGVIWYQGESNAHNSGLYEVAFQEFIASWRRWWNDPELPFFMAQLSGIDRPSWPRFRDMQRKVVENTSHTGMVVTYDLGDSLNVHPIRKKEVGERFAFQALAKVYGKNVLSDGPLPVKMREYSWSVVITFRSAGKMQTSDGKPLRELEVAGNDGIFARVQGIITGKKLVINLPGRNVSAIRYAWEPFSRGNLVNHAGLPAPTFRIEKKL